MFRREGELEISRDAQSVGVQPGVERQCIIYPAHVQDAEAGLSLHCHGRMALISKDQPEEALEVAAMFRCDPVVPLFAPPVPQVDSRLR